MKNSIVLGLTAALLWMSGCNSSATSGSDSNTTGPNTVGSGKTFGSLSGSEDVGAILKEKTWTSLKMDLDKYLYDTTGSVRTYKMQMDFTDTKVNILADCYILSATYKIKDNALYFSRVSSPKPDLDNASCNEFENAENAAAAFLTSDYDITTTASDELVLQATDVETSATLKR